MIRYANEPDLNAKEFVDCLIRSTLAQRRPVEDLERIEGMLRHADLVITARTQEGLLVGIARAITDYHYCTYLSDLAVDTDFQNQGIGRKLLEITHQSAGPLTKLILLSAPKAEGYYPHIGLIQHPSAWTSPPTPSGNLDNTLDSTADDAELK